MELNDKKKKEPWRYVVGIASIVFIVYMWIKNDIINIYTSMPKAQVMPLIITTIGVSLAKVAAIAGCALLIRWIIGKIKK